MTGLNCTDDVSVLVLTGDGSAFSSGGNVREMSERSGIFGGSIQQIQDQYRRGIQRIPLAMEAAEVPLIAAINGPAIGAGFDLACMCDLRIGSAAAVMGETFVNLGIIPGDGGAWFLQRLVGYQRAAELTLTGRLVSAQEALALGNSAGGYGVGPIALPGAGTGRSDRVKAAAGGAHDQETSQACPARISAGLSGFMRLLSGDGSPHGRPCGSDKCFYREADRSLFRKLILMAPLLCAIHAGRCLFCNMILSPHENWKSGYCEKVDSL